MLRTATASPYRLCNVDVALRGRDVAAAPPGSVYALLSTRRKSAPLELEVCASTYPGRWTNLCRRSACDGRRHKGFFFGVLRGG